MSPQTVSHSKLKYLPWIVWVIAAMYFFYDYMQQMAPGVMGTSIIREFNSAEGVLSSLASLYFLSYAVMQIPVGIITDHFGPHRPLVIAALVAMTGSMLFALAQSMSMIEASRLIIGFGTAFAYVATLKLVSNWFPASRFATMAGMTSLVGMIGAIVGGAPLAAAVTNLGWRGTSWILVAAAGGLAILIWLVVRDHPAGAARWEEHPEHGRGKSKSWQDLKHVVTKPKSWISGIYITTMNITFTAVGATWGTTFIQVAYGIDKVSAAVVVSMLFVGGLIGAPFWGWLSDRIHRRRLPMIVASVLSLVFMLVMLYLPGLPHIPLSAVYVLFFVQGFCCNGLILGYAVGNDIRPPGSAGMSMGFANTVCAGGTTIFLHIITWLANVGAPERAVQGLSKLHAGDFRFALIVLPVCLGIATIAGILTPETHCQLLYDEEKHDG
jgi:MFS family permease